MDYDIGEAFNAIENELIDSMMRNFSRHRAEETKEGFNWAQWQAKQLKSLEQYRKANIKKFNGKFTSINNKMAQMIRTAHADGGAAEEAKILNAVKNGFNGATKPSERQPTEFFKVNERKLNALIEATTNDMQKAETAVLRLANDQYRKIIYNAQVYANTGAGTYEKAVDMATKDFLSAGINCIVYKNGRRVNIKSYAEMALRTANKRAYLQGEGEKRQEWGVATVILNKRSNPCPLCVPFVGKVFIDDVWSGGSKDGISNVTGVKYPLLSEAIHKGLYHPNCRDSHTTYFEGISTPPKDSKYTADELDALAENYKAGQKANQAEHQAERMERLGKYSLDRDNKRAYTARAKQWRKKAGELNKSGEKAVAKSSESGIIKEKSAKPITKITDNAINRVPKLEISGYTDEQCAAIQEQHKELLRFAHDNNDCKEVAFVFNKALEKQFDIKGTDKSIDFGNALHGKDLFVMHNHPRNSSYSFRDIVEFIANSSIKTFTVVKNNGNVEILTKLTDIDKIKLLNELQRLEKNNVKTGSDSEYQKIIRKFLNKYQQGGLFEWKK